MLHDSDGITLSGHNVNKYWAHKEKDQAFKDKDTDKDKDLTYNF